ncbi:uncharacterized protein K452DRAFT_286151 [Aplosporella prunicola CBS 121167]|uniref:L-ornithine N(5)-monooxygenase n=1 Tax=Aplosporella prunicola CBS 121167 TaxID=1176127 RepID=A0A6A6BGP9_9PEZI|nr:uncharacterized protein K452DRAFT_286151 [Aplosporella prunicola CBS 121167]KAF2143319.1 hypothetical protein K452DRAFT_286151 [Aplosporella prunicola CBS 121167]
MAAPRPGGVFDTVIVGNGPSALILSYILHGNIPYYARPHHDAILRSKLDRRPNLLHLTPDLYAHFLASLRYSTQALPINTLLDTLIRPNADTEVDPESCVDWRREPNKAVSHLCLGDAAVSGGQWAENPVSASSDIGTLSYAEMLSLPGYSFADHWQAVHDEPLPQFLRPSRTEVQGYYKAYPRAAGIADSILCGTQVRDISRTADGGFLIGSHGIRCKHLVLASGIFSVNIPPPLPLRQLAEIDNVEKPLLVVGSGFSAADVIISAPPSRKIIHMFNWSPDTHASPLRGCHHQAYPEYATIYRQMKLASMPSKSKVTTVTSPPMRKKNNPFFSHRDWASVYEGFANAEILDVKLEPGRGAKITIKLEDGEVVEREAGGVQYVIGRRGSLGYLDEKLRDEVIGPVEDGEANPTLISGRTLRDKAEIDLEVAPDVFIIGSLTGDSLVRHAFGGCAYAAGRIVEDNLADGHGELNGGAKSPRHARVVSNPTPPMSPGRSPKIRPNGVSHQDLHLDRRKLSMAEKN